MSRSYTFEPETAQRPEYSLRYIDKPGTYIGTFTAAWYEQSTSGAECIKFKFIDDFGSQANNVAIYTHRANGEKLPGYSLIQKIMACMRVKTLNTRPDTVELYDYHSKKILQQPRDVYPGLCGPIGLLLTTEEYETRNGIRKQVIIRAAFEAQSRLMADEILSGSETPTALEKLTQYLTEKKEWHKPLKTHDHASAPAHHHTQTQSQTENDFADNDVPF